MKDYMSAAHAIQSGVAMEMNYDNAHTPKHLRTGIDLTKADMEGLVTLLISKGVFTHEEYVEAITKSANNEVERYEKRLSDHFGKKITLG